MRSTRRETLPDALRALALLGVLVVNAVNYPVGPSGPTLGNSPSGWVDAAALFLVAALMQGKAYPLLACLFGAGLVWGARGRSRQEARRRSTRRQRRLLLLGLLHGTLLYFGDILAMYALCAWSVWSSVHERSCVVIARLRRAILWALSAVVAVTWLAWWPDADFAALDKLVEQHTVRSFVAMNAENFVPGLAVGLVLILPLLRLFMLAGIVVARLRLLTHPRWLTWRAHWCRRLAPPVLATHIVFGLAVVSLLAADGRQRWLDAVSMFIGPPLSAWYALALACMFDRGRAAWATRLAPLGRRTLSVYVTHSIWCAALFAGVGLGWSPGRPTLVVVSVVLWCTVAWAAAMSPRRWPLEWWIGRGS